jgi:hypothetical protein
VSVGVFCLATGAPSVHREEDGAYEDENARKAGKCLEDIAVLDEMRRKPQADVQSDESDQPACHGERNLVLDQGSRSLGSGECHRGFDSSPARLQRSWPLSLREVSNS